MDMIFQLSLEDVYGNTVCLTDDELHYVVTKIDGLYPPSATLSTDDYVGIDGSFLTNAYIAKRNLVISISMPGSDVEKYRQALYHVVQTGKYVKISYSTSECDVWTEGYVESITMDHFSELTTGQISILCPDIYWYGTETVYTPDEWSWSEDYMLSRVTVTNNGDEIGFIARVTNSATEAIYVNQLYISVTTSSSSSSLFYIYASTENNQAEIEIPAGGYLEINTKIGQKGFITYDSSGNKCTDYTAVFYSQVSDWVTLKHGSNVLDEGVLLSDSSYNENISIEIYHTDAYLGV